MNVIFFGDLYQLPPVKDLPIFSDFIADEDNQFGKLQNAGLFVVN